MTHAPRRSFDLSSKRKALLDAMLAEQGVEPAAAPAPAPRIPKRGHAGPSALSFAQQRLWFVDQFQPNSAAYNIPMTLRVARELAPAVLERTLSEIVRRHEVLRTRFVLVDGTPMQGVLPAAEVTVPLVDLRHLPTDQRDAELQRLTGEEVRRPFDLARGPHFRVKLLRLGDADDLLVLTLHHIVVDGWSTGLLLHEISTLYEAFGAGRASPLKDLPIQYADFAEWQRAQLSGESLDAQLAYWKKQLAGAPAVLELPADRQRPSVQTFRGSALPVSLSRAVTEQLKALSQREGATLFMILLAAFTTLLHRYSRQSDIVVGSPIANRTCPEVEALLGPFANTLALRSDLSGERTFRDLLRRVRETTLSAYAHQDLPFEKLVEQLHPERNLSHSPIFQVLFVLQNVPTTRLAAAAGAPAPEVSPPLALDTGTAKFDLTLSVVETPQGLSGLLEYSSDLFDAATIERMVGHLQTLASGIAADPDRSVGRLPLLPEWERRQVLVGWNETRAGYREDRCVHQLFEDQVERTPHAPAVEIGEAQLTYRALNRRANQVAHALIAMGITPGECVGICVDLSFEMIIGLLGVLKAGGVHTPLDPAYPKDRLAYMLDDVEVRAVLTLARLAGTLPEHQVPTLRLDADWDERFALMPDHDPPNRSTIDDLAYVIFTSGSTGRPKGVAMVHRSMANLFAWQAPRFRSNAGVRTVQFTSFSFDVSFQEILSTLSTDGVLVLLPESLRHDFGGMVRFLAEKRIQRLFLPFTALHHLAEAGHGIDVYPAHLQDIVSTGEQMHLTQPVVGFLSRMKGCVLHNQYGPTETHFATAYPLEGDPKTWPTLPSIGRPISNTRIYVLDEHRQPVPIGVPGEVYIGGVMVARCYLNHEEMTSEKFTADPFAPELFPGEGSARIYKTGDLARLHADGNLEYLGRIDHQVKLRGFRIELGEIEGVLIEHPAVRDAVVALREDTPGDKRLVVYFVPPEGHEPSIRELRAYLKEKLPDYMVPAALVAMDALPLTPNGKVDRRALRAPEWARPALSQAYVAPRSAMESQLTTIWTEVLGAGQIGIYDNFFELGGHSLLATQVISRVRAAFHVSVPLRRLFEAPTIADLALAVAESQLDCVGDEEAIRMLLDVGQLSAEEARRLSDAQRPAVTPPT